MHRPFRDIGDDDGKVADATQLRRDWSVMKILGFDSWTGGAAHYQRLLEAFRRRGMQLTLVHLGSWGSDKGRPPTEWIGDLPVRDISSYQDQGFAQILEEECAAAVIFLSTDTFAHRSFNRYCRHLGIPTVNLFHGLITVQATGAARYRVSPIAQARFVARRLLKALTVVWPNYAASLWRTNARAAEWRRFGIDIVCLAAGRFSQVSADDARTDVCCVFAAADVEYAAKKYGFQREDIVAVGNPDLLKVGLSSAELGSHLETSRDKKDVMYVDTGLIHTGFVFNSAAEFIDHLISTRKKLEVQGKHLVVKPHPAHLGSGITDVLSTAGIEICENENFVSRLKSCCACIAEPSTLAVIPALMGMPLFLAGYGKLRGQPYGDVLTKYPRAVVLSSLDDFTDLLASERARFVAPRTLRWITENAGPMPAEDMPERVVDVVARLVNRNTQPQAVH